MKRMGILGIVMLALVIGIVVGILGSRLLFVPMVQAETSAAREVKVVTLLEQVTTAPNHPLVKILTIELPPGATLPQHMKGPFLATSWKEKCSTSLNGVT
jgi:hypothetical protein